MKALGVMIAAVMLAILSFTAGPTHAASANGPYYATPAWDQKLDCTSGATCPRFVVLSNWNGEAVLDRETGLVWEQSPADTIHRWFIARSECTSRTVGGRKGWRLPSIHELASLIDPSVGFPGPSLPAGHPFTNVQTDAQSSRYWSATTVADNAINAWFVRFNDGDVFGDDKDLLSFVWCVRGVMNADAY